MNVMWSEVGKDVLAEVSLAAVKRAQATSSWCQKVIAYFELNQLPEKYPLEKRTEFVKELENFFYEEGVVRFRLGEKWVIFVPKHTTHMVMR